jgi:hypothetical protein
MTIRIREISRHPTTGAGQAGITVSVKRQVGNTTVDDDVSDAQGITEFDHAEIEYPGPVYSQQVVGADTTNRSGSIAGQVAGLFWETDIPDVFEIIGYGIAPNIGDAMAVTAAGDSMNVSVGTGVLLHKGGLPYVIEAAKTLTIPTSSAINPRIDRIIIRLTREGQAEQGKIELLVLEGTPAATPAPPNLAKNASTWDFSLAQVAVGTSVSVIASDKVTDERRSTTLGQQYAQDFPSTRTPGDLWYINSVSRVGRLALGDNNHVLKSSTGLGRPVWAALALSDLGITASAVQINYLNTATSNIQTQLNAHTSDISSVNSALGDKANTVDVNAALAGKVDDFTQTYAVTYLLGNGIDVITSAEPVVQAMLPEGCTLFAAHIESLVGGAGNLRVNIARATSLSLTYTDIDASDPLALSAATIVSKTSFTGWTTNFTQYDKVRITVDPAVTPTNVKRAAVVLRFTVART